MGDTGLEPTPENTGKSADSKGSRPTGRPKKGEVDTKAIAEALAGLGADGLAALLAAAIQSKPVVE